MYPLGLGELSPRLSLITTGYPESQTCHVQNNGRGVYYYGYHDRYGQWIDCVPFDSFDIGVGIVVALLAYFIVERFKHNREE